MNTPPAPYARFTPSAFLEPRRETPIFEPQPETPPSPEFSTYNLSKSLKSLSFPKNEPIEDYARITNKVKTLVYYACNFNVIYEDEETKEEQEQRILLDTMSKCVVRMIMTYLSTSPVDSEDEILVAGVKIGASIFGLDDTPECHTLKSRIHKHVNTIKYKSFDPKGIWNRIRRIEFDLLKLENYTPCKMEIGYLEEIVGCARCQAITKAGKQCERDAQTGDIKCWQHNT